MNDHSCNSYKDAMSRRSALKLGALGLVPWLLSSSALSQVKLGGASRKHTLVVLFLRGGADGLNMLIPYADDAYHRARPSLGIANPNDLRAKEAARSVQLTDYFALHPSLRLLKPWYENGTLALAHAVGSQDVTRSHFEAMSAMERGAPTGNSGDPSGWLARYLGKTASKEDTPLRAVAWAERMPDSLRGAPSPLVVQSVGEFQLHSDEEFVRELKHQYQGGENMIHSAGANTLHALESIERLDPKNYKASGGAVYPVSPLGKGFREVACLMKSDLGLEIACLEDTGWDSHFAQGSDTGIHANNMANIAQTIDAFLRDMGSRTKEMTLIVMTEFGRRVQENASLGTDHGRASVMMAFGAVPGGKIHGDWPGIGAGQLDEAGDLRPVNDYRKMLTGFLAPNMPEMANIWG